MTTDAERQAKAAAKVDKLLALAADPSATEAERQNAAARAADMKTRNGITAAQLAAARGEAPEQVRVYPFAVQGTAGQGKARATLAVRVAEALGCHALTKLAPAPRPCMAIIVGMASDVETLRVLLPLLLTQAEHAAAQAASGYDPRRRAASVSRFLVGYGDAVAERIAERRHALQEETKRGGTGADLMLTERAQRVRAVYDAKFPAHVQKSTSVPGASEAGRSAGRRANLGDGGVTGGRRSALTGR